MSIEEYETVDFHVVLTRKAILVSSSPKEVLLYAQCCLRRFITGRVVDAHEYPILSVNVGSSMSKAFGTGYQVSFKDNDEVIDMVVDSTSPTATATLN